MKAEEVAEIDANEVVGNLWQGSLPPQGGVLRRAGFDAVFLCAREHQPSGGSFRGIRVFRAPLDDDPAGMSSRERDTWLAAASKASSLSRSGARVLVTCFAGLNRSGIVVAQALQCTGYGTEDAIFLVRRARGQRALFNQAFVKELMAHRLHDRPPEHPLIVRP